jgi:hypothetical protein
MCNIYIECYALLIADSIQIPKYAACVITHPKSLSPRRGTWPSAKLSGIFNSLLRRGAGGEVFGFSILITSTKPEDESQDARNMDLACCKS